MLKTILTRRSIRQYNSTLVAEASLKDLLKAGAAAPSAHNLQPWHFVVITERETLLKLANIHPYAQMLKTAPAAIIVCGDTATKEKLGGLNFWIQDCAAATQNILLAAHGLGLGSCWCGVYPNLERCQDVAEIIGLPRGPILPFNLIAIGHTDTEAKEVDRLDEAKVHWQQW